MLPGLWVRDRDTLLSQCGPGSGLHPDLPLSPASANWLWEASPRIHCLNSRPGVPRHGTGAPHVCLFKPSAWLLGTAPRMSVTEHEAETY